MQPNYVAAWPSEDTALMLRHAGIEKAVHLTTFFDGYSQLGQMAEYPWIGPKSARIAKVKEWQVGERLFLIAELTDCEWSAEINQFYHAQGAREDLKHLPHLTLQKNVKQGAAEQYQSLVGATLVFDRHGFEQS